MTDALILIGLAVCAALLGALSLTFGYLAACAAAERWLSWRKWW